MSFWYVMLLLTFDPEDSEDVGSTEVIDADVAHFTRRNAPAMSRAPRVIFRKLFACIESSALLLYVSERCSL